MPRRLGGLGNGSLGTSHLLSEDVELLRPVGLRWRSLVLQGLWRKTQSFHLDLHWGLRVNLFMAFSNYC